MLDIVGLCGSLRRNSVNRAALRLAGASMPADLTMDIAEWRDLPLFDADTQERGIPAAVAALAQRLARADGVVIATPEYNYSVPGAFKNVIDWISRLDDKPLAKKPIAILSASPGLIGGARMQYDLRRVLFALSALPLAKPEVFIGSAYTKFDADGHCTDEATRKFVSDQMAALVSWIADVARMHGA